MLPLDKVVSNATEVVVDQRSVAVAATKAELLPAEDEHREYPKRDKPLRGGVADENCCNPVEVVYGSL